MVSKLDIYIRAVTSFTYFHIIGNFKHIWNSIITWERNPINANNVVSHLDLQYLQVHRRNTRAEPNGLKDCGKSFCFHGSFKQHKRTHTVEKTHEYKKCSKILLQFWSLSYIYIYIYEKSPWRKALWRPMMWKSIWLLQLFHYLPKAWKQKNVMCIVEPDSFTDIPAHKASPSWETTYSTRVGDTASILLNYLNQRKLSNNVLAYNFHLKKFL